MPRIHVVAVLASKEGIERLLQVHPDINITVGKIDEYDETTQRLVGLGDSGDRLFGTAPLVVDDEEALMHPTRRKRGRSQSIEQP